ncbi:type 1 fimbrial protein [Hafnia alvei]|uniref:Type 1 fimbrial protein n=2 Tax=Hafnia alvei TaxID=569 RepID=A0ABD7QAS6_HAFAL|nr:type 1 fimbrial protein [Hafnia alvei]
MYISAAQGCLNDCAIDVYFTGTYTEETCNVEINNTGSDGVVTLPVISVNSLRDNASEAGSVPFNITLGDCPANRTIGVLFNSTITAADSETGNLLNDAGATYSKNVQVRLRNENSDHVIIDDADSSQDYIISSSAEPVSHTFIVSYYANGDAAVTAGKVYAVAGVELVYK